MGVQETEQNRGVVNTVCERKRDRERNREGGRETFRNSGLT